MGLLDDKLYSINVIFQGAEQVIWAAISGKRSGTITTDLTSHSQGDRLRVTAVLPHAALLRRR